MNRTVAAGTRTALQPGEPFNPYLMFTGIFIPEGLVRCTSIRPGAKLAWGRLARYAGEDGRCYPKVKTLASEIGVRERQLQNYLKELEQAKLIQRVPRFRARAQTSNPGAVATSCKKIGRRTAVAMRW